MTNATRYTIQFADGSFSRNCSGRRTHKTAALAQKYIAASVKGHQRDAAYYAKHPEQKAWYDVAAGLARWQGATVVPV